MSIRSRRRRLAKLRKYWRLKSALQQQAAEMRRVQRVFDRVLAEPWKRQYIHIEYGLGFAMTKEAYEDSILKYQGVRPDEHKGSWIRVDGPEPPAGDREQGR